MNHQVDHDVVEDPRRKRSGPDNVEMDRVVDNAQKLPDRWIEAFHVSDLEDQLRGLSLMLKVFAFFNGESYRFLDENVNTGGQKFLDHCVVVLGGGGDYGRIELRAVQEIGNGCELQRAEGGGERMTLFLVDIDDCDEFYSIGSRSDSRMVGTHLAGADDGYSGHESTLRTVDTMVSRSSRDRNW